MFKLINYNFKTNINLIVLIWCVTKLICVSTNHIVSNSSINETNVLNDIGNVPTENVLENQIPADNTNGDDKLPVQLNAGMRTKRMLNVDNGIPLLMYTHHNDPSNKYKRCRNRNHQPYEHNPRLPLDNKLESMHHPPLPHLTHTTTPCNCPLNQYNGFGKCYCGKPTCDCKRRKKFPKLTPENINYIYNLLHNKYHHPKQEIDKMFRIAKDNPGITTEKLLQSIHSVTTEKVAKTNGFIRPDLEVISTPGITMKEVEIPRYHSPLDITTNQVPKKFPEDGIYILEEKQSDLDFISTNFAPEGNTESISYFNQRGVAEPTEDFYDTEISIEETSPLVLQLESNQEEPFDTLRPKPLKNYLHFSEKAVASSESESDEVIQRDEDVLVTQDMISDVRRLRQKENEFTRMLSVKHKAPLEKIVVLDKLQPLKKPISNNVMLIDRANTRLEKPPEVPLDPILVQQKNGFNFDGVEEVTELEKKYKGVTGVQRNPGSMGLAPTLINRINQDGTMTDFIKFLSTKQGVTKMLLPPQEVSTPNLLQPTIGKPIYPTKIPPQKSPILSLASTKIQKIPAIPPASESTCGSVTTNNIETIRKQITQQASPPVSPNVLDISTEPTVFCTCHKMINGEVFPINNGEAFIPNFPLPTQALEALSNQYKDIVAQIENGIIKDDDDFDPDLAKDIDLLIDKEIKKILDADCCSQCKQVDQAQRASFEILDPDTKLETIPTKYEDSNEPLNLSFLEDDSRPFTYEYVSEESPILGEISKLDRISTEIEKETQNLEVQTQGIEKTISNLEDVGDEFSYEYVTEEVSSREARHSAEDVAPDPLEEISTPRENLDEFTYEYVTEEESSSEKLQNPPPEIEVATGSNLPGFGVKEEEVKPLVTENIQKPVQEPRINPEELQIPHPEIEKMETDSKLPGFVVKSEEIKPTIEEIKNIQEPVQEPTMNPEILQIHHPEIEGMEIAPKLSGFNEIENIQHPLQEPRMDPENLQNPLVLPGVMAKPEEYQLSIQEMENIHKPLQETGVVEDEFTYEYVTEEETSQENPKIINEVKPKLAQELEVSPVPEPEDEFTYEYVTEEELSQENSELSPVVSLPEPTQNILLNQKFVQQEAIPQIRPIADPKPLPDLMGEIKANIPTPIEILAEFTENSQLTPVVSLSEPTQNVLPNKEFVHQEEIPQYHPEQLGTPPIADPNPLPDVISEIKEAISTPQEVLDEFTYEYVTEEVSGEENVPEIQEVQKQEFDPVLIKTEKGIIPTNVDEQTTQILIENDQIPNSEYLPNQELGAISEIIPEIPELISSFHNNNSEKNLEENVESVTPKYPEVTETTYTVPELISNFHNRYPEIIPEIELPPNDPTLLESQNPYFPPIPEEIPQPNLEPEIDLDLMGSSSTEVQHIELPPETLTITPENNTEIHLEMEHSPILTAINYGISHKVIEPDLTHFPDYPDITTEVLNGHIEKSSHNPIIQALNYNFEHMLDPSEIHYVPDTNNEDYSYESSEENDIPVLEKVPDDSRKLEEVKLDNSMERNNPEVIVEDPDEVLQVEATESHETIVNPDSPDDFTYEYITVEATSNETQTNPLPLPEIIPETKTKIVDLLGAKIGLSNSLPVEDYSYEYVTIESSSNENNKKSMEDLEADSTEVQYETLNQIQEIQESNKVATEIESPEETSSDLTSSASERKIQTIPGHIYEITSQITDVKNKNNVPAFIPGTIHITSSDIPEHMRNRITEKMINACQVSANDCQVDHNHNSRNEILTSLWEDSPNEDSIPLTVKRESTETPEEEWNPRTSLPLPEETIESLEKEIKPTEMNQKWSPRQSDSTIKIEPTEISQDLDESSSRIHPVFQPRPKYITEYESYEVTSEETTEIIHPHTPIPPMDPKLVTTLRSVFGSGKIVTERPNNKKFLNGQLYFVSNTGIRIPLKITRNNQGSLQLTLDVTKVCPNHCPVPCNCKCDSSSSYESESYSGSDENYSGSDESQYSGSDESEEFYYKRNSLSRKLDTMLPRLKRVPREIGASPLEITTLMEKNSFIRNHFAHLKQKGDIGRFNRHLDHQRVTLPQPMTTAETGSTTSDVEETTPEVSNMVENVNFREVSPDWKGGTTTSSTIVTEPSVNEMSSETNQIEHYFHRGHHRRLPIRSHLPVDPIWTDESAQAEEDLQDDVKTSEEVPKPHEELTNLDSQTLNNPWTLKSSEKPEVLQDNMKLQEHRVLFGNIQLQNEEIDDEIFSRHRKDHHRISANTQSFSEYPTPQNFIPYQPYDSLESLMTQLRQNNHFLDDGPKDLPTQKNFHQVSPDWKGGTYPNHHEHEMNENQLFFHKNNDLHENLLHKERHHQFPSLEPLTKFDQNVVPKNDNFRVKLPLQSNENQQFYDAIMDYLIMESARIPQVKEKSSEDVEVLKRRLAIYEHLYGSPKPIDAGQYTSEESYKHKKKHRKRKHRKSEESVEEVKKPEPKEEKKEDDRKSVSTEMFEERIACDQFVNKRMGLVRSVFNWVRDWVTETAVKTKQAITSTAAS